MDSISVTIVQILIVWGVVVAIFGAGFLLGSMLGKSKLEDELAEILLAESRRSETLGHQEGS